MKLRPLAATQRILKKIILESFVFDVGEAEKRKICRRKVFQEDRTVREMSISWSQLLEKGA